MAAATLATHTLPSVELIHCPRCTKLLGARDLHRHVLLLWSPVTTTSVPASTPVTIVCRRDQCDGVWHSSP